MQMVLASFGATPLSASTKRPDPERLIHLHLALVMHQSGSRNRNTAGLSVSPTSPKSHRSVVFGKGPH